MNRPKKINKNKNLETLIRLTWDSLQSHLKYTHRHSSEGRSFHQRCVKDYAEMIKLMSEIL